MPADSASGVGSIEVCRIAVDIEYHVGCTKAYGSIGMCGAVV